MATTWPTRCCSCGSPAGGECADSPLQAGFQAWIQAAAASRPGPWLRGRCSLELTNRPVAAVCGAHRPLHRCLGLDWAREAGNNGKREQAFAGSASMNEALLAAPIIARAIGLHSPAGHRGEEIQRRRHRWARQPVFGPGRKTAPMLSRRCCRSAGRASDFLARWLGHWRQLVWHKMY